MGGDNDRFKTFQMKNGVAIYGGFNGTEDPNTFNLADHDFVTNETILSGEIGNENDISDSCYHVFYHTSGLNLNASAILDGFTIKGGYANGSGSHNNGGGTYNDSSSPSIRNCAFISNWANYGGGMFNTNNSAPELTKCIFKSNRLIRLVLECIIIIPLQYLATVFSQKM